MKRMLTILTLVIMGYCSHSFSMAHGHNGKAEREQQQAAAQANQAYQTLEQELNKNKPNDTVLVVLTAELAESMSSLSSREQRIATATEPKHAATNKKLAEFKTKKQKKLHDLSQKGNKIVELLTLVTTGPEGASSGEVITQFIQQGVTLHRQAIKIDCMVELEFAEKFYALLKDPRIQPFAAQGLQPRA